MATKYEKERKALNDKKKKDINLNNEIVTACSEAVDNLIEIKKQCLPELLEERKNQILTELKKYEIIEEDSENNFVINGKSYPYQKVIDKGFKPIIVFGCKEARYSPAELYMVLESFDYLCDAYRNLEQTFTPTLDLFLRYADMSTSELNKLRTKPEYEVVVSKIDVFICSYISDNAMKRLIDPRTAELLQKADHKKRDRDDVPQVINVQQNTVYTSADEEIVRKSILDKINSLK